MSVEAANRFYAEVQLGVASARHSELNFYPTFAGISAGMFVKPNIGIELFADGAPSSYETGNIEFQIKQASGVALRLQSPAQRRVNAYVLLGYVSYLADQTVVDNRGSQVVQQRFEGARVSIGMQQRLVRFPALLVGAEYRHYNSDSGLSVDGLALSFRFNVK